MTYDAQKIKEIATRLGVSQKTVMQYLREQSLLQSDACEASLEHAAKPAQGAASTARSTVA